MLNNEETTPAPCKCCFLVLASLLVALCCGSCLKMTCESNIIILSVRGPKQFDLIRREPFRENETCGCKEKANLSIRPLVYVFCVVRLGLYCG